MVNGGQDACRVGEVQGGNSGMFYLQENIFLPLWFLL